MKAMVSKSLWLVVAVSVSAAMAGSATAAEFFHRPDNHGERVHAAVERIKNRPKVSHHSHKGHANKVRYGKRGSGVGYYRKGPEHGYGFRFATYRGDPFGKSDYWDRNGCYYQHGHNYCLNFTPPKGFPRTNERRN